MKKIKKTISLRERLSGYFIDFASYSSLHGMKYMGEKTRRPLERLSWLAASVISLIVCFVLIGHLYRKWEAAPIILTYANSFTSVWEIPFPAITICPPIKTNKTLFSYSDSKNEYLNYQSITHKEWKKLQQLSLVCNSAKIDGEETMDDDIFNFLLTVSTAFEDGHIECIWNGNTSGDTSCANFLTPLIISDGVCYTFNMLGMDELLTEETYKRKELQHDIKTTNWNLDDGYAEDLNGQGYPRRSKSSRFSGFHMRMAISLSDLDYACTGPTLGFKIFPHSPVEFPSQNYFMLPLNQEILAQITPDMVKTPKELERYSSEKRQCYFSYERQLKYFQVYTQSNCQLECFTNYTWNKCKCVEFYMPRNADMNICGPGSMKCVTEAETALMTKSDIGNGLSCNCLPACNSLTYNIETSQTDYKIIEILRAIARSEDAYKSHGFAAVTFAYKQPQFISTERTHLYELTDFIANCGGLLGLFIGFSLISVVEIIYFSTLRVLCNIRKQAATPNYDHITVRVSNNQESL